MDIKDDSFFTMRLYNTDQIKNSTKESIRVDFEDGEDNSFTLRPGQSEKLPKECLCLITKKHEHSHSFINQISDIIFKGLNNAKQD